MKRNAAVDTFEAEVISSASHFTTCRFAGRGRFETERHASLDDALAAAKQDGRTMIYAVSPEGRSVHVQNV